MTVETNKLNGNIEYISFDTSGSPADLIITKLPSEARLVKDLRTYYDNEFLVTPAYKESLPDMQNTSDNRGAAVPIQHAKGTIHHIVDSSGSTRLTEGYHGPAPGVEARGLRRRA